MLSYTEYSVLCSVTNQTRILASNPPITQHTGDCLHPTPPLCDMLRVLETQNESVCMNYQSR